MTLRYAAGALEEAARDHGHPLCDAEFVAALLRLIPADGVSLNDLRPAERTGELVDVVPMPKTSAAGEQGAFWEHFWGSLPCSYTDVGAQRDTTPRATTDLVTELQWRGSPMYLDYFRPAGIEWELVVPLPSAPGVMRRLVLFRGSGKPFGERETAAALVLRPHVVEALRAHDRREAASVLTPRQRELVDLCALGLDNAGIARSLRMSSGTVRKHLENAFVRMGVRSRGEAVAATRPDMAWS
jgi:DNA-binding CsgD family transcriptional regulator